MKIKNSTFNLLRYGDRKDGFLCSAEVYNEIPFAVKRVYYIYEASKNTIRGFHAHRNLEQIAYCPYGKIQITLDDGNEIIRHILDQPEKTLYIGKGIWREMKWLKKDSVLCVIASEKYDEDDYIRDYEEFKKMVNEGFWDDKK